MNFAFDRTRPLQRCSCSPALQLSSSPALQHENRQGQPVEHLTRGTHTGFRDESKKWRNLNRRAGARVRPRAGSPVHQASTGLSAIPSPRGCGRPNRQTDAHHDFNVRLPRTVFAPRVILTRSSRRIRSGSRPSGRADDRVGHAASGRSRQHKQHRTLRWRRRRSAQAYVNRRDRVTAALARRGQSRRPTSRPGCGDPAFAAARFSNPTARSNPLRPHRFHCQQFQNHRVIRRPRKNPFYDRPGIVIEHAVVGQIPRLQPVQVDRGIAAARLVRRRERFRSGAELTRFEPRVPQQIPAFGIVGLRRHARFQHLLPASELRVLVVC